ncbi:anti-sigma factor family protein [Sphingomonas sp. ID0503]|uniref:anti-sigma factor family protein n=1 Tax=Sphingomonas sp. ID0503 TaxID=3399691 RepID=UPI003AFAA461
MAESIAQAEIDAYVDDELDLSRRLAVETYLAAHPAEAARMMRDAGNRTGLRMLLDGALGEARQPDTTLAQRLTRKLERRRLSLWRRPAGGAAVFAAAAALAVTMVPIPAVQANPPAYVADAVQAYQTGLLRRAMVSQVETVSLDAPDIMRRTSIRIPRLPAEWTITDVQIFPSDEGPALQIMVRTPTDRPISIFAVHAHSDAPTSPVTMRHGDKSVAYWRTGSTSYALTGIEAPEALDVAADDLADNQAL